MLDFDGNEYMRGFDYPEYIFTVKELIEILHERRIDNPEYRQDLDDEYIRKLEAKSKIVPLLKVS